MNVAEFIISELIKQGIDCVFGYQGGNITYIIDAIGRSEQMEYVQTYNEQGASFAANAYGQVTNNFGVAVASSGPGAINMINGIANAYYDSIPCLFITGNINTATMRKDDRIRQNGFQEADIVSMVKGITKYAVTVHEAKEIKVILEAALKIMKQGRPGPVLLDIPHNIQRTDISETDILKTKEVKNIDTVVDNETLEMVMGKLQVATKPVLLVGGGCRSEIAKKEIVKFLEQIEIPVVASLCGIDVLDNNHKSYRGMIGSYGFSSSNKILQEADFVLVLGSRLDERQRSVSIDEFLKNAKVVHVDIDENELKNVRKDEISIHATVEQFMVEINKRLLKNENGNKWLEETKDWIKEKTSEEKLIFGLKTQKQLQKVVGEYPKDSIICVDVGSHQMAAAQAIRIGRNSKYLNSGGLGSMGYALPAAIGACYGDYNKKIICITGDGGIMMNLQELQVIAREKLPIMIVVMNNKELGMIKSYQDLAFEGRNYGAKWGYIPPDFPLIAKAFHMNYYKADEIEKGTKELVVPAIVEIEVQNEEV